MFESQGPKVTFGGGERTAETSVEPAKPKPAPKKKEDGPMNERKWVFDTIQKYFDVIVEEEKEEDEEDEDEEGEEEEEDEEEGESESDYTDAEDELPEINIPPPRERSGTLPTLTPFLSKPKPKELPRLNLPSVQRTSSLRASPLRASTVSPATIPVRKPNLERKVSTVSIDECIDDAAKQFDQLTDGSDLSLDRSPSFARGEIQKSSSSSRIRSMFSSVMQSNSNTSLNVAMFKTNLQTHLSNSRAGSRVGSRVGSRAGSVAPQLFDPDDDSSSDFSEYD